MNSEEANLIVITNSQDDDGFPVETERRIPVYVREKSVRHTEFYEALRTGYTPRVILVMRVEDWELSAHENNGHKRYATKVEYDGETYEVVRSFKTSKSEIQITCS